jgi:histidinol dehydrogenase
MKILPLARYRPPDQAKDTARAQRTVNAIIAAVRRDGDAALCRFSRRYDHAAPAPFRAGAAEIAAALELCPRDLRQAMRCAMLNLRRFASRQMRQYADFSLPLRAGVTAGQRALPIARIGIYVPGGRFPLFSSLLMAAVPAQVAGVPEIAVFSPPAADGRAAPAVLAAAGLLGIGEVYALGGAQAIAAMAYGSESVRPVHKIVGPGNLYVSLAKLAVFGRAGIDLPAGPSEVLILADGSARPELIAADLLAQAEHDPLAVALLATPCAETAARVRHEVRRQLQRLPTASPAHDSLKRNGAILLASTLQEAVEFINRLAPEHLELHVQRPRYWARRCTAFGSLFIGSLAAEALGDYCGGVNHVLPTAGAARFSGGLSVRDFLRLATTLEVSGTGLRAIGPVGRRLAAAENLTAHARSLALRLDTTDCKASSPVRKRT